MQEVLETHSSCGPFPQSCCQTTAAKTREEGAGDSGEHIGAGRPFCRSADDTTHLHHGLHHADRRGERTGEKGPEWRERGGGIQSRKKRGERKINEKQE